MPDLQLVDQYGRPVSTADLKPDPPLRRSSRRPAAFNPEPDRLSAVFKAADQGDPREHQQILADIESRDGHIGGVLDTRKSALAKLQWRATATTNDKTAVEIADAVQRDILDARWYRPTVKALSDAVTKGWSVCTIGWQTGDVWRPVNLRWVDQQMTGVTPEDDQRLAWRMTKDETKLEPIAPYTAIVHAATSPFGALYRRGIGRSIAILYSLKRLGLQTWASYVEMFGLARPVADYPVGSKESDIEAFEEMLQAWAQGGYLLKPANLKVNFPEPASASRGAGEPVHATLAKYCDAQASKRIIGQTMTSDSGSSRAQGEVHERVAGWITEGDAADMGETVTRDLVEPYVFLNYGVGAPVPRVYALIESSERRAFQLEALKVFVPLGMKVEQSVARDIAGVPEPEEGAELLGARTAAPAGARRRQGADFRFRLAQLLAQRSALAEDDDGEDLVDRDAGADAASNWRRDLQPFVDEIEDAAASADGFDDFLRRVARKEVDGDKFVRHLAAADMGLRGVGDGTDEAD